MSECPDNTVALVGCDASWGTRFVDEAHRLKEADLPGFVAVEHIGSTAVPGLVAKPIIDIAVAVDIPARTPRLIRAVESLGYRYYGTFGLRGRHFFRKGEPATVHLHLVHYKSNHWRVWLDFRDALRAHPEWLRRYEDEKQRLADMFPQDRAAYTAGKSPIVAQILAAAGRGRK
jgi:GrpB-like predicted nucleotidyltransferase (UPF0157 family)